MPSSRNTRNSFCAFRGYRRTRQKRCAEGDDGHGKARGKAPGGHTGNTVRRVARDCVKEDGQDGHDDDRVGAVGPVVHHPADLLLGKFFRKPMGETLRFVIARIAHACINIVTFWKHKTTRPIDVSVNRA